MAIDPYDGNFSAKSLQAQIDALRSSQFANTSFDITSRMREVQAASAYESMMRMQQAQQSMLRAMQQANIQLAANQTPMGQMAYSSFVAMPNAMRPTGVFAGRNIGYTATGAATQSFGGLLADAGLSQALNALTQGIAYKGWSQAIGASRAQVQETARDELRQRFGDFGRNAVAGMHPDWINRRFGMQFSELEGDLARQVTSAFSTIRSPTARGLRADGVGLRLRGDIPRDITDQTMRNIRQLDRARGYSLTDEDASSIAGMVSDTMAVDGNAQRTALAGGGRGLVNQLTAAFSSLERALQANATEVRRLHLEGIKMGMSTEQITKLGETIGRMTTNSSFSNAQEMGIRLSLMGEGRSAYYGSGDRYARMQRNQAEALREELMRQGSAGMAELYRFGGSSPSEAAMLNQARILSRSEGWLQQHSGSLGLLAANGQLPTSMSALGGQLGSIYGQDPFAQINMLADPDKRLNAVAGAELASYEFGKTVGAQLPQHSRALAIMSIARQNGISIPEAAEMYRKLQAKETSLTGMAGSLGVPVSSLMMTSTLYDRAGLRLPANPSKAYTKAVGSGSLVDMISAYDTGELSANALIQSKMSGIPDLKSLKNLTPTELAAELGRQMDAGKLSEDQVREIFPSASIYKRGDGTRVDIGNWTQNEQDWIDYQRGFEPKEGSGFWENAKYQMRHGISAQWWSNALSAKEALTPGVGSGNGKYGWALDNWSVFKNDGLYAGGILRDKGLINKDVASFEDAEDQKKVLAGVLSLLNSEPGQRAFTLEELKAGGQLDDRASRDELVKAHTFIDAYRALHKVSNPPPVSVKITEIDPKALTALQGK